MLQLPSILNVEPPNPAWFGKDVMLDSLTKQVGEASKALASLSAKAEPWMQEPSETSAGYAQKGSHVIHVVRILISFFAPFCIASAR